MKKSLKYTFTLGVLVSLAATFAASMPAASNAEPQDDTAAAADMLALPGTLRMQRAAGDDMTGSLKTVAGAMSFQTSSLDARGRASAKGGSPDRVRVRLEINGAVLEHELDVAAGTLTVRAPDPVAISAADREVLKSFQTELGRSLALQGSVRSLPKPYDMLWRLSEMYSEVPLGHRFEKEWVIRRGTDNPITPQGITDARDSLSAITGARPRGDIVAAACSEKGGGSFINLKSIANVCDDDRVFYRTSYHDYCPSHGYSGKTVAYGCGSNSCAGRCGAGCGVADGLGAWYQDCLDHDVCNRDHNSQLGGCGDEWTEAADDYAFGTISCYTTCG